MPNLHDCVARPPDRTVSSWTELREVLEDLANAGWAFRGQANASWPLESSLTRYLKKFRRSEDDWVGRERKILYTFQRKAHLLVSRTPADGETLEWLALMQHHGAPTRLLDFTWSPYVAAFFALEQATDDAAIWAILSGPKAKNLRGFRISEMLNRVLRIKRRPSASRKRPYKFAESAASASTLRRLAKSNAIPQAVIGEPVLMNQRMTTQAGTFVTPLIRIDVPIESVLPRSSVFKLNLVTSKLRTPTMDRLYNMNINNATLFPGIDGLARSLAYELEFEWTVDPTVARRLKQKSGKTVDESR